MALHIIDRRLAGKNKSVGNRERFLRRYKDQIAEAVRRAVSRRGAAKGPGRRVAVRLSRVAIIQVS